MAESKTSSTTVSARELVIERILDAPRELVFRAWTDPRHMAHWWGPRGFRNAVCELDVRRGGAVRVDMCGPDGVMYPMGGAFQEIVAPERLVFTSTAGADKEGNPQLENHSPAWNRAGARAWTSSPSSWRTTEKEKKPWLGMLAPPQRSRPRPIGRLS